MKTSKVEKKSAGYILNAADKDGWEFVTEADRGSSKSGSAAKYICPDCFKENMVIVNDQVKAKSASKKAFVFYKITDNKFKRMAACPCGFRRFDEQELRPFVEKADLSGLEKPQKQAKGNKNKKFHNKHGEVTHGQN